jgi:hypothetical protein
MVDTQLTGDLPQRTIRGPDQIDRILAELLGILRRTWHQDILPQAAAWFQGVRSRGGTSVAAIVEATEHGRLDAQLPAVDILAFVLGLVASWASSSPALRMLTGADNDDVVRERRRRSIHTAVARLVTPT